MFIAYFMDQGREKLMYHVKDLSFQYPTSYSFALKELSFDIHQGEFVLIAGKSGSGKSTLLRLLKKELMPTGITLGTIELEGVKIKKNNITRVGFIFQNPDDQMVMDKVWRELAFGLENMNMPIEKMRHRVAEIAQYFKLQDIYHEHVDHLSDGQKQIVNLASVMVMQPDVLLLDEPTARLDPLMKEQFILLLKRIAEDFGTTIILVEHQFVELLSLCSQVLLLDKGHLEYRGSVEDTFMYLQTQQHPFLEAFPDYMHLTKKQVLMDPQQARFYIQCHHWHYRIPKNKATQTSKLLEIEDLILRYDQKRIFQHLNLTLYKQDFVCLLGANGSGKTTLLRHLYEVYGKKSRIKYQGHWITKQENQEMALLPQNVDILFSQDSVKEELDQIDASLASKYIDLFSIEDLVEKHPYDLSGGEKRIVGLIMVLLSQPKILLLDEPTNGCDIFMIKRLATYLKKLQQEGLMILCVSHDIDFCARYSDHCGLLFDGQVDAFMETREFFKHHVFYTTTLARLFKSLNPKVLLLEDVYEE